MSYNRKYNPKRSFIRIIGLILILVFGCTMLSMGLNVVTRVDEPDLTVESGSNFYLTISLMNPESDINGNYIIISDKDLKASVETALKGSGFETYWDDKQTSYNIRSEKMLRKSWDEQVGWFFDALDKAYLAVTLLYGGPRAVIESEIDPVKIVTSQKGTPVDWTLDFGDSFRDSDLQRNTQAFENCMKRGEQFRISGSLSTRSIPDGILIPPTTDIIIQIPLKAPEYEGEHQISLNIPYYYTAPLTYAPVPCGFKIAPDQVTWKKIISVKKKGQTHTIFEDDFSSDKEKWISSPPSDIVRNSTENNVQWHADRSYDQRMYRSIDPKTGDFNLKVDSMISDLWA
jgi:hypothetical protein